MNGTFRRVPPSPEVMASLYAEYRRTAQITGISFKKYLEIIGYINPAIGMNGMDDAKILHAGKPGGQPDRIAVPSQRMVGEITLKVLLVDFSDRTGTTSPDHYRDLLFSKNSYPTGSMRDYYDEASRQNVQIGGAVHGWLRMPNPYSYYVNNESGTEWDSYPRNVPRLAEDAVRAALDAGVVFTPKLDKLDNGTVTALFIVHAGFGAESMPSGQQNREIWSHKWRLRTPIQVAPGLWASIYLVVPQNCRVGVCAHELGHLAFQWDDFYDPNYAEDGAWDGAGVWDVMAGGAHNEGGKRPAHPAGLHKAQHGWVTETRVTATTRGVVLKPYADPEAQVVKVLSPQFKEKQYLILENRRKQGFDRSLPGEGLLVWRVDETREMVAPDRPGLALVQADGKHQLENPSDWNDGDAGDPFPGTENVARLGDAGNISTSFAGQTRSGVSLENISRDADTGDITLDIVFQGDEESVDDRFIHEKNVTPQAIPDNDPAGIVSEIAITRGGAVKRLRVAVDIRHSYIGDLLVVLRAPSGKRVVLHGNIGGSAENLRRWYDIGDVPELANLVGRAVTGTWGLEVSDNAGADTGTLNGWELELEAQSSVFKEVRPDLDIPDNNKTGVHSPLDVTEAGVVKALELEVDISHTWVGDLVVSLIAPSGKTAVVYEGREDDNTHNLKQTWLSGSSEALRSLRGESVQGRWLLKVVDRSRRDIGTLNRWRLGAELMSGARGESFPDRFIPDDNAEGIADTIAIEASGKVASAEVAVEIVHTYIGDLVIELRPPSGQRTVLRNQEGEGQVDLSVTYTTDSAPASAFIGQEMKGDWTLRVVDLAGQDVGRLVRWSLNLKAG